MDRLEKWMMLDVCRWLFPLFEVGIDILDTAVDAVASLPTDYH